MFERYLRASVRALFIARNTAGAAGCQAIGVDHLVAGAIHVLPTFHQFEETVLQKLDVAVSEGPSAGAESEIPFSPAVKRLLQYAMLQADQLGHHWICPEHLLLAVLEEAWYPESTVLREAGLGRDILIQIAVENAVQDDRGLSRHQGG